MTRPSVRWRTILIGSIVSIAAADNARAASVFPWKSTFTQGSSPAITTVHEAILKAHVDGFTAVPITGQVWSEEDFELKLESGTLFLEPPIDGQIAGGFFEGKASVSFRPASKTARTMLEMLLDHPTLESVAVSSVYLFSLRPDSLLARPPGAAVAGAPTALQVYHEDKSAMRQLGMELTAAFLNRKGPSRGATYALFPMESIRDFYSKDARLLYRFNPALVQAVSLHAFGDEHDFWDIASYDSKTAHPAVADVSRYGTKISLGTAATSAVQEATVDLALAPSVGALRFDFWIQMEVSEVKDGQGRSLPFAQWETLRNDPDRDQTLLVLLDDKGENAGGAASLTIKSAGVLFEPWLGTYVLIDEDNWYPTLPLRSDVADYELELTIPKRLEGIGIGQKISDEPQGNTHKVLFRTTQPSSMSTFYYGDYNMVEKLADDIKVELYQDRTDLTQKKQAEFISNEISNALKVYNRLLVPLDIKTLRVTPTQRSHGRGFEGLLLLGGGGTEDSSSSYSDMFRAHEVAHQWWGHYVRTARWPEDRWLSESFAEYFSLEYYKIRFEDPKRTLMLMSDSWLKPLAEGSTKLKSLTGAVEKTVGSTVFPLSAGTNNVYTKGPLVLHMLRYLFKVQKKTDDVFFAMLKDFLQTYKYKPASTSDFQAVAEKHLGMKLDWFFAQWIDDGGIPVLKWSHEIVQDGAGWAINLKAAQEQKKYRLIVPVYIRLGGDKMAVTPWVIEGESATRSIKIPSRPESVSLNDNLESLLILKAQ